MLMGRVDGDVSWSWSLRRSGFWLVVFFLVART